jgi:hypothetical protein
MSVASPVRGASIRIFLVDGTPQGIRLVERMGWTGSLLAFARADYARARLREELARAGTYVLVGADPEGRRSQTVYVGEADVIRTRLDAHQKEKDFWTHGYILTAKDNSLNKAHGRFLEARLLSLAFEADNATIDNGTAPDAAGLTEPEVADMESYLDTVLPLFVLVGVNVFEPADEADEPTLGVDGLDEAGDERFTRLYLRTNLTEAVGEDRPSGFLVHEGALGRAETKTMVTGYQQLRERLVREDILVTQGEQLRLTRSFLFDSPSAAASVLSGGSKNGRSEWRDANGKTLKEIQKESAT